MQWKMKIWVCNWLTPVWYAIKMLMKYMCECTAISLFSVPVFCYKKFDHSSQSCFQGLSKHSILKTNLLSKRISEQA